MSKDLEHLRPGVREILLVHSTGETPPWSDHIDATITSLNNHYKELMLRIVTECSPKTGHVVCNQFWRAELRKRIEQEFGK
jgi:hypothetical protein